VTYCLERRPDLQVICLSACQHRLGTRLSPRASTGLGRDPPRTDTGLGRDSSRELVRFRGTARSCSQAMIHNNKRSVCSGGVPQNNSLAGRPKASDLKKSEVVVNSTIFDVTLSNAS